VSLAYTYNMNGLGGTLDDAFTMARGQRFRRPPHRLAGRDAHRKRSGAQPAAQRAAAPMQTLATASSASC
jgi:hypothetical protein